MGTQNLKYDPKELDVTAYTRTRLEDSALARVRGFVDSERMFEQLPRPISNDDLTRLVDDLLFLKKILVVEGCRHQCTFCFYSSSSNVKDMYFDDFTYALSRLEGLVQQAGIPMFYTPAEFAFHRNGESIMYIGSKNPQNPRKGWLPEIVSGLRESSLLDRGTATRNVTIIYTAGFYDVDAEKTITSSVSRMVGDPERYFGSSAETKGRVMFSMHSATRYFRNVTGRGLTADQWINSLVDNFRLLRPLYEDDRLTVSVKVVEDTPKNQRMLNNHSPDFAFGLLEHILRKAEYGGTEAAVTGNPSFLSVDSACNLGGGKRFEKTPSYVDIHEHDLNCVQTISELRKGNPSVYLGVDGKLVRVIPKLLRGLVDQWVVRETQLSLPSQWRG